MKRLWGIRHIRYFLAVHAVNQHYDRWLKFGYLPINAASDHSVCEAIWRGEA